MSQQLPASLQFFPNAKVAPVPEPREAWEGRLHVPSMLLIHASILWYHHLIRESVIAPHTFSSLGACDSELNFNKGKFKERFS